MGIFCHGFHINEQSFITRFIDVSEFFLKTNNRSIPAKFGTYCAAKTEYLPPPIIDTVHTPTFSPCKGRAPTVYFITFISSIFLKNEKKNSPWCERLFEILKSISQTIL